METTTQTFRVGHAADADWETLVASVLRQIGDVPAGANIGFVYVTDTLDGDLPLIAEWNATDLLAEEFDAIVGSY